MAEINMSVELQRTGEMFIKEEPEQELDISSEADGHQSPGPTNPPGKIFKCPKCNEEFICVSHFLMHIPVHTEDEKELCTLCRIRFKNESDWRNHMLIHSEKRPYTCKDCLESFSLNSELKRHEWVHRLGPFFCSKCNRKLETGTEAINYRKIYIEKKHLTCTDCDKRFAKDYLLERTKEKSFPCSVCNQDFTHQATLLRHKKQMHHICPVCSKRCKDHNKLRKHLTRHINDGVLGSNSILLKMTFRPYACAECGKRYQHKSALQEHSFCHIGNTQHQCSECGSKFETEKGLRSHSTFHSKLFKCSDCEKTFLTLSKLKLHRKIHPKEPAVCRVCGKRLRHKAALLSHMRCHREKSFPCFLCTTVLCEELDLTKHLQLHHHVCPVCEERFTERPGLKEHLRIHVEDGTLDQASDLIFSCSTCDELFLCKQSFRKHMRNVHKGS